MQRFLRIEHADTLLTRRKFQLQLLEVVSFRILRTFLNREDFLNCFPESLILLQNLPTEKGSLQKEVPERISVLSRPYIHTKDYSVLQQTFTNDSATPSNPASTSSEALTMKVPNLETAKLSSFVPVPTTITSDPIPISRGIVEKTPVTESFEINSQYSAPRELYYYPLSYATLIREQGLGFRLRYR